MLLLSLSLNSWDASLLFDAPGMEEEPFQTQGEGMAVASLAEVVRSSLDGPSDRVELGVIEWKKDISRLEPSCIIDIDAEVLGRDCSRVCALMGRLWWV